MANSIHLSCAHLGLKHDPSTAYSYPSYGHICHYAKGQPTPKLAYQHSTFLTRIYINCNIYLHYPETKMPKRMREPSVRKFVNLKAFFRNLLFMLFILLAVLSIMFYEPLFALFSSFVYPAPQHIPPAEPSGLLITPSVEITLTPTLTKEPTASLSPTPTPKIPPPTASPTTDREPAVVALSTPIGRNVKFIILRVSEGQALGQFATLYNKTEDAIRGVNFKLPTVLILIEFWLYQWI